MRERLPGMNKARRLSVRVQAIGWEVYVSTDQSDCTRTKIANLSADGAYLITKNQYQPGTQITLTVKSALLCFSASGLVLRSDSHGIAVRFLDLSESARNSILNIISRFLLGQRQKGAFCRATRVCNEGQLKFNFDL